MARPAYTPKRQLVSTRFVGGMANDEKEGVADSFARVVGLEHRKHPTSLTLKPKARLDANQTIVTDLIVGFARVANGDTYSIGTTGRFYKRTVAGVWSLITTLAAGSAFGILYRDDADAIYLTTPTYVARYWPISGVPSAPTMQDPWAGNSADQTRTGGTNAYTAPNSISEAAVDKFTFQPTCSPQYSVKLKPVAKTTGTVTVTLHDDANTVLGTLTVNVTALTTGVLNEFVLPAVVNEYVKPNARTYHVHVTSNTSGNTFQTTTASDWSTADFETWAQRFEVPANGMHPIGQIAQYTLYGNGRYVAVHEPLSNTPTNLEFNRHKLVFPPGYQVTGFSQYGELVAITCEKRSTDNTARFQDGKIFVWDGTAATYNYFINVPSGSPYSPFTADGILYYIVNGKLKAYSGSQPVTIHNMPGADAEYTDASTYAINYPQMASIRNEVPIFGWPSETNSLTAEMAIYGYGTTDKNHAQSFSLDNYISTGSKFQTGSNNLRIGAVQTFGEETFISWRDDGQASGHKFGVDIIDNFSDPNAIGSLESLKIDFGLPMKEKSAEGVIITFEPLPSGASVTPKYRVNRSASWVPIDVPVTTVGATQARMLFEKRFYEAEYGFDITGTTTTPKITGVAFLYDVNAFEAFVG